ncbi:DNA methyltransferase [Amycolatopsis cihanbeyliensis]|nr:DNA methyltransferase [Amycolatopsis cihanbeyliensis]
MPWRVAFGVQAGGWILRNAVINRLGTGYEIAFLFARQAHYQFDVGERNVGDVWALDPVAAVERCIAVSCRPGGVVLDPFCGGWVTGLAAGRLGRRFLGPGVARWVA